VPGERGSAVIDGHLDSTSGPAVFWKLKTLRVGDQVQVIDQEGRWLTFAVERVGVYADSTFPIDLVFAQADAKRLNLITCEGAWDRGSRNYADRLVVFTKLVE
jgi:sortase (surface protein transpeptidase)